MCVLSISECNSAIILKTNFIIKYKNKIIVGNHGKLKILEILKV